MFEKIGENLGQELAGRWLVTVFSPAFAFWIGGFLLCVSRGDVPRLLQTWTSLSIVEQSMILGAVLVGITFTAALVQQLQGRILSWVEGYWPRGLWWLRFLLARRWTRRIQTMYARLDEGRHAIDAKDKAISRQLDAQLARLPVEPQLAMPTLLGNLLRAVEEYPGLRYGLDAMVCWPRLYLLLPKVSQEEIGMARERLNEQTRLLAWSLLFLIWTFWQPWALFGVIVAWLAYRGMINAATVYGDLVRAAFDLYRFDLYRALAWQLPEKPDGEELCGRQLTSYLFRGFSPSGATFIHQQDVQRPRGES